MVFFVIFTHMNGFAQIEKATSKDTITFRKWEVSVDMKPLFRQDESYSLLVTKYFTEKSGLRIRVGFLELSNSDFYKSSIQAIKLKNDSIIALSEAINGDLQTEKYGCEIGYRYGISKLLNNKNKISLYAVSNLYWDLQINHLKLPTKIRNYPFERNLNENGFKEKINQYGVRQSLGVSYKINSHISVSTEIALSFQNQTLNLSQAGETTFLEGDQQLIIDDSQRRVYFHPLSLLTFNYHF